MIPTQEVSAAIFRRNHARPFSSHLVVIFTGQPAHLPRQTLSFPPKCLELSDHHHLVEPGGGVLVLFDLIERTIYACASILMFSSCFVFLFFFFALCPSPSILFVSGSSRQLALYCFSSTSPKGPAGDPILAIEVVHN